MRVFSDKHDQKVVDILLKGGIGILRTDTIYGVVCCADNKTAVNRLFAAKGRDDGKSPIVLIAGQDQMFDMPSPQEQIELDKVWPGKVSIIINSVKAPSWITRGNGSVAYRLPADDNLRKLLEKTGPLIAPSANPQGVIPATTIDEAKDYFGETVDFYIDEGEVNDNTPSQLLRLDPDGIVERLR